MGSWRVMGVRAASVLAVVAFATLAVVSASPVAGASAAVVGNDISFPQCGSAYPTGQAFGIVGVNDGLPNTVNPCLGSSTGHPSYAQSELYWAVSTSTGSSTQPKASVYVNTADPGNVATGTLLPDWPTTVSTSSGPATAGENSPACAWEYGDQKAAQDATWLRAAAQAIDAQSPPVTVPTTPSGYPWWLDVETTNTWLTGAAGQAMNVAVLQGIVVGLTTAGAPSVGVYAPPNQWVAITGGTTTSTATIGKLATWVPGASDQAGAQAVCAGPSFTGGPVALAQFPSGAFDGDLPCNQPPVITATRIDGQTADETAAAELTRAFQGSCPPTHAVVLATTREYQDALSSQLLAQYLTTGTLLTPTTSLAQVTATTLRVEGINTVYLVGGPLAISPTVASAIGALTAYECGGTTRASATGKIAVHRIFGQTQYGTAMAVAEYVGSAGTASFPVAYATTNATGGTGRYNDTAAKGSAAPLVPAEPTAILASGQEFQDAQAASVISYHTKLPMLLTSATTLSTTAVAAITRLGIKQVILLGGPLAVTNAVEATLVAKTGVSVLRVAGKDYTDTARELARFESAGSPGGLGWTPGHRIMLARGDGFTDGLCGAVLENPHNTTTGSAGTERPLMLSESPTQVGGYLTTFLKVTGFGGIGGTAGKTITSITVLGGPLAVSTASIAAMKTDLGH
ncbi:MAG: cell wall-binding repeat-containing protein [Actinomycetota bacterium]|nr:cell wall-binding repeat-containing protein [Actinomycetota bacterium]